MKSLLIAPLKHHRENGVFARLWRWLAALVPAQPPQADTHSTREFHQAAATNHDAFEAFFRSYEPRLTGYLWRMTGNNDLARDLCQEAFVRAWQHFDQIKDYPQPETWLFRVAAHLAINLHRKAMNAPLLDIHPDGKMDLTERFVQREAIRRVLSEIAPRQRTMLILREVNGHSCAEIAHVLGVSVASVKMGLSRAREQFRIAYRKQEQE